MKNFSKLLSVIICVAMLLSVLVIVGCNNDTPDTPDETTATPPVETPKFKLGVCIEGSPYLYSKDDKLEGICIDIAAAIMNEMEIELELKITDEDQLLQNLVDGEYTGILYEKTYDLTSPFLQQAQYSDTIVKSRQIVLTAADSEISKLGDLAGKKIGVVENTSNEDEATKQYGEDNVSAYSTTSAGLDALKAGDIDAYIVDFSSVKDITFADEGLKLLSKDFSYKEYCIYLAVDDTSNLSNINDAVRTLNDAHKIEAICNEYLLGTK